MITLTPEQLYHRISKDGIKQIQFYEGYVVNPKNERFVFHRIKDENPETVLNEVKEILNQFPALFTLVCSNYTTGSNLPAAILRVDGSNGQKTSVNQLQGYQNNQHSFDELYQKVLAKVKADMERQNMEAQINHLKTRLQGFEQGGEKVAFVLGKVVEGLLKKNPKVAAAMQGYENETTPQKQHTMDTIEIKQPEKVKECLETLLKLLGENDFIAVTEKLAANPDKVQTIKLLL